MNAAMELWRATKPWEPECFVNHHDKQVNSRPSRPSSRAARFAGASDTFGVGSTIRSGSIGTRLLCKPPSWSCQRVVQRVLVRLVRSECSRRQPNQRVIEGTATAATGALPDDWW